MENVKSFVILKKPTGLWRKVRSEAVGGDLVSTFNVFGSPSDKFCIEVSKSKFNLGLFWLRLNERRKQNGVTGLVEILITAPPKLAISLIFWKILGFQGKYVIIYYLGSKFFRTKARDVTTLSVSNCNFAVGTMHFKILLNLSLSEIRKSSLNPFLSPARLNSNRIVSVVRKYLDSSSCKISPTSKMRLYRMDSNLSKVRTSVEWRNRQVCIHFMQH